MTADTGVELPSLLAPVGLAPALPPPARAGVQTRVVIVGGGFAGLAAARALGDAPVAVTLIDRNNFHLFQPLLYQVATAGLAPAEVAYPIRTIFRRQQNVRVLLGDVTSVDLDAHLVSLVGQDVLYDFLVVATGARHAYFGHADWERDAPGLKSLEDALEMRRRVLLAFERAEQVTDPARRLALLTFVVVGGGPTGVELAGAIAELACQVLPRDFRTIDTTQARTVLVEAGPRLLPTFPASLSTEAEAALRRRCVDVRTGAAVTGLRPGLVVTTQGEIPSETVLWAAGVEASSVTRTLGVSLDPLGRVIVGADLRVKGHAEVMVIGDAAAVPGRDGGTLPGLAPVAIQEGRHVARTIERTMRGQPAESFRYRDRGLMATIGRGHAVAVSGRLRFSGRLAWWAWLLLHLVWLIGFRNRAVVLIEWAWAYIGNQRAGRLILAPFLEHQSVPAAGARSVIEDPRQDIASPSGGRC